MTELSYSISEESKQAHMQNVLLIMLRSQFAFMNIFGKYSPFQKPPQQPLL